MRHPTPRRSYRRRRRPVTQVTKKKQEAGRWMRKKTKCVERKELRVLVNAGARVHRWAVNLRAHTRTHTSKRKHTHHTHPHTHMYTHTQVRASYLR